MDTYLDPKKAVNVAMLKKTAKAREYKQRPNSKKRMVPYKLLNLSIRSSIKSPLLIIWLKDSSNGLW